MQFLGKLAVQLHTLSMMLAFCLLAAFDALRINDTVGKPTRDSQPTTDFSVDLVMADRDNHMCFIAVGTDNGKSVRGREKWITNFFFSSHTVS